MAISVDWGQKIINVPKADMALIQSVPTEIRQLNLDTFRLTLRDLEDNDAGMPFPRTHNHNTSVEVGGVILARVVEIVNGYTVTFEDGQYAVNLVGANSNVGDVVNVNQVSVRSANSAGLQDLSTLLIAAYDARVCVDLSDGQPGTDVPVGTRAAPVNNMADAITIAEQHGIRNIQLLRSATLTSADFSHGYTFLGDSAVVVLLTIQDGAAVHNCQFQDMTLQGVLDGQNIFRDSNLLDINYVNGFVFQCALNGTVTLGGLSQASILNCFSNVAGGGVGQYPVIDFNNEANSLALRGYSGGVALTNYPGGGNVSIDMASGRVVVDASCTGGDIYIRGNASVEDNSTGTCTVHDDTTPSKTDVDQLGAVLGDVHKAHYNRRVWNKAGATITLYEADKLTPATVFDTNTDMSEITPQ